MKRSRDASILTYINVKMKCALDAFTLTLTNVNIRIGNARMT